MFVLDEPDDAPLQMDYSIWALRNAERTVVVDVGCGRKEAERRGHTFLRCPSEGLRLMGIDPAWVQDVIITHMHFDHAGNLGLFPNARFHVQQEEIAFATGPAMTHPMLRHPFRVEDVTDMVRLIHGDRVLFYAGDGEIAPGITVHHIPGHARGLQSVNVHTQRGWVLIASDAAHYYDSFLRELPFRTHESLFQMLQGFRCLRALAPSDAHIVPGHDPAVLSRYPAPSPDLSGIVARLDVDPL
jgi:glyoxylase-like metal-dependent hydrolase (beta-lactamase superfamily II)